MVTSLNDIDKSLPQPSVLEPFFPWVVFDMDGTLVDSFGLIIKSFNYAAGRYLQRELGIGEALSVQGRTLEDQLANYVPSSAVPTAVDRYHGFFIRHFNSGIRVYPGIQELLLTLQRRGIRLAVCTGADKRTARHTLIRSGLFPFFSTVVTGDDVSAPKPDPEGLRIAMEAIDANSKQAVYVGDHPNDILASKRAGAKAAGAFWGSLHRNQLEELKPDFIFKHPHEALRLSAFQTPRVDNHFESDWNAISSVGIAPSV